MPSIVTWVSRRRRRRIRAPRAALPRVRAPTGYSLAASDCDDHAAAISPAAAETCDARDDDCNGRADYVIAPGNSKTTTAMASPTPCAARLSARLRRPRRACRRRPARDVQWPRRRLRRPSRRGRRAGAVLSRRRRPTDGARSAERNDGLRATRLPDTPCAAATATISMSQVHPTQIEVCTRHGRRLRYAVDEGPRRRRVARRVRSPPASAVIARRSPARAVLQLRHAERLRCRSHERPDLRQLHESLSERRLVVRAGPLVSANGLRGGVSE